MTDRTETDTKHGDHVEAGETVEDYDHGYIIGSDDRTAEGTLVHLVAWEGGQTKTWTPAELLRPHGTLVPCGDCDSGMATEHVQRDGSWHTVCGVCIGLYDDIGAYMGPIS